MFDEKPERKRRSGRPQSIWKDKNEHWISIRYFFKIYIYGCEKVDCIYVAQERDHWRLLVNAVMNHQVP